MAVTKLEYRNDQLVLKNRVAMIVVSKLGWTAMANTTNHPKTHVFPEQEAEVLQERVPVGKPWDRDRMEVAEITSTHCECRTCWTTESTKQTTHLGSDSSSAAQGMVSSVLSQRPETTFVLESLGVGPRMNASRTSIRKGAWKQLPLMLASVWVENT